MIQKEISNRLLEMGLESREESSGLMWRALGLTREMPTELKECSEEGRGQRAGNS